MNKLPLLVVSVLPILVCGYYIYKKDFDAEPTDLLIKLLVGGVLSVIPVFFIEHLLDNIFPNTDFMTNIQFMVYIFIDIAFVEEVFKWFIVYTFSYGSREFDYMFDGIVYATFVSLGFAAIENLLYVVYSETLYIGLKVGILRGLISVPSHVSFGIIMGIFLSKSKKYLFKDKELLSALMLICSIIIPSILHAIFDCLLYLEDKYLSVFCVYYILLIAVSFICLTKVAKEKKHIYYTKALKIKKSD